VSVARAILEELTDDDLRDLAERLRPLMTVSETRSGEDADRWLTAAEAAAYVGMSYGAFKKYADRREMRFEQRKPGGKRWFRRRDLDAWRASSH
jgi:excisionase family DNA binding protein